MCQAIDVWNNICVSFVFLALLEYALVNYAARADARYGTIVITVVIVVIVVITVIVIIVVIIVTVVIVVLFLVWSGMEGVHQPPIPSVLTSVAGILCRQYRKIFTTSPPSFILLNLLCILIILGNKSGQKKTMKKVGHVSF